MFKTLIYLGCFCLLNFSILSAQSKCEEFTFVPHTYFKTWGVKEICVLDSVETSAECSDSATCNYYMWKFSAGKLTYEINGDFKHGTFDSNYNFMDTYTYNPKYPDRIMYRSRNGGGLGMYESAYPIWRYRYSKIGQLLKFYHANTTECAEFFGDLRYSYLNKKLIRIDGSNEDAASVVLLPKVGRQDQAVDYGDSSTEAHFIIYCNNSIIGYINKADLFEVGKTANEILEIVDFPRYLDSLNESEKFKLLKLHYQPIKPRKLRIDGKPVDLYLKGKNIIPGRYLIIEVAQNDFLFYSLE